MYRESKDQKKIDRQTLGSSVYSRSYVIFLNYFSKAKRLATSVQLITLKKASI
jgi:hypothetical protein